MKSKFTIRFIKQGLEKPNLNSFSKYLFAFVIMMGLAVLPSCDKDEVEEAGNIPGMGNAGGELQVVEPFVEPDGFVIEEVRGVGEPATAAAQLAGSKGDLKSVAAVTTTRWGNYNSYGCGGRNIKIKLAIRNKRSYGRCLWLPRGCVFEVSDPSYQHGILACWTPIWVNANSIRHIILEVFCINQGKSGSNTNVTYRIKGVTKSLLMKKFLMRCNWRKINKEFYYGSSRDGMSSLKSMNSEDLEKYAELTDVLQDAIWTLTNGDGSLSEEQIDYIESLPMMPADAYPEGLGEEGYTPPEDWSEYGVDVVNE
ncbi:hypothetical protein [Carboxylicivirga sp. RSCT41]|uniref:hypothetical protein n=1 Tax=Carboxylicivirga agarovorans TaxID=3417570 RepID=UPI003D32AC9C